jgi:hypothetical protein
MWSPRDFFGLTQHTKNPWKLRTKPDFRFKDGNVPRAIERLFEADRKENS